MSLTPASLKTPRRKVLKTTKKSPHAAFSLCVFASLRETTFMHRIASCLSSLDELIAAETKTLEALKVHKRGLMQQLFPAGEGERRPAAT